MEDKSPQLSVMVTQWIDFEGKSYEKKLNLEYESRLFFNKTNREI